MKAYSVIFICLFGLSGCVNYLGIHPHSTFYNANTLATAHTYSIPKQTITTTPADWWLRFNDPQLNQLIKIALADSPNLKMAANRVEKALYIAKESRSTLWPSVDLSTYVEKTRFPEMGLIPPPFNGRVFNIGSFAFNLNYELDFWGKNREALAARWSQHDAQVAELADARLIIATAVASAYFQLQNDIEQHRIAAAISRQRQALLDIISDRARHGIDSDIPVKTAVTDAETAKLAVAQYKRFEMQDRHELAALLGKNPLATKIIAKPFSYRTRAVILPAAIPAHLLKRRPDLHAACARAMAAAHDINVAKAAFFPDFNLNLLFSYQSINLAQLFKPGNQYNAITPAIDLPIFDANARRSNLHVKDAEYDLAVNQYNQTLLTALREVADQITTINALKAQVAAENEAFAAAHHNYQLAQSRYQHGIIDYANVLQTRALALQQKAGQIDYQSRHRQAVVAMIKALGGDYLTTET